MRLRNSSSVIAFLSRSVWRLVTNRAQRKPPSAPAPSVANTAITAFPPALGLLLLAAQMPPTIAASTAIPTAEQPTEAR